MSLAANLIADGVFAGYENFVSRMDSRGIRITPAWMGTVDFSTMKLKLIASIVAISAIHLLEMFMSIESVRARQSVLLMMLHGAFVVSGMCSR